jgi:hypothetical protein
MKMGWGTSWDKFKPKADDWVKEYIEAPVFTGIDLGTSDTTVLTTFEDGEIKHRVIPQNELFKNKIPTHDPYTNPGAFLYYECECGQILDPKTKRFAELNNCASNTGWKVRWGSQHYIPYCVECAREKEIE